MVDYIDYMDKPVGIQLGQVQTIDPSSTTPLGATLVMSDMISALGRLNLSHSLCVSAVRVLRRAGETKEPNEELSAIADYFSGLFLKTPAIANALQLLHAVPGSPPLQKNVAKTHGPYEWAHLFSAYYLTKRLYAACTSPQLRPSFEVAFASSDLAYRLWLAIPAIPLSDWIVAGTIRPLSLLVFALLDEKQFVTHRRALRSAGRAIYDAEKERALFNIDHTVFCSYLCQQLGFGAHRGNEIKKAFDNRFPSESLSNESNRIRAAALWIDSLTESLRPPSTQIDAHFYPGPDNLKKLTEHVTLLRNEGATAHWLDPLCQGDLSKAATQSSTEVLETPLPDEALKHLAKDIDEEIDI